MILELERLCRAGIGAISRKFFAGDFSYPELTETIRLSLIGGGMDPEEASALLNTYAARMSITDLYAVALPIIETLFFGSVQSIAQKDDADAEA